VSGTGGVAGNNGVSGANGASGGYGGQTGAVGATSGQAGPSGHGRGGPNGNSAPSSNFGGGAPVRRGPPHYDNPPEYSAPVPFDYQSGFTALAAPSGACGTPPELPDTSWYTNPIDGIEVISLQTQNHIQFCGCNTQACVADALDNYANALEKAVEPAPPVPGVGSTPSRKLPRAVRELPRVVHEAAERVRTAPTNAAAQKAVEAAIEIVQKTAAKTIALMRADDPDAKRAVTRGTDLVADTLKSAQAGLMRAETL
jgi:hypothetical protein